MGVPKRRSAPLWHMAPCEAETQWGKAARPELKSPRIPSLRTSSSQICGGSTLGHRQPSSRSSVASWIRSTTRSASVLVALGAAGPCRACRPRPMSATPLRSNAARARATADPRPRPDGGPSDRPAHGRARPGGGPATVAPLRGVYTMVRWEPSIGSFRASASGVTCTDRLPVAAPPAGGRGKEAERPCAGADELYLGRGSR